MHTARCRLLPIACLASLWLARQAMGTAVPAAATTGSEPIAACPADAGIMDGWDTPAPPRTLFANVHYVGTCGISALLLTSAQGHILIDGGTPAAGPAIAASIQALGYRLEDIGYLLVSHEHYDHAGGLAWLQQASGAVVVAQPAALDALRSGHNGRNDPQAGGLEDFPPIANVRAINDGQTLRLGPLAVTAHATPGHAPGGTSWSWQSCQHAQCLQMVYADSLSAASRPPYRFSDHPGHLAAFRASIDTVAGLPCDVLLTPHPLASQMPARLRGDAALVDAGACRDYAAAARRGLQQRLASESAAAAARASR